jgi:hypothetical protein
MLHSIMNTSSSLGVALEDLLAELSAARRSEDLGRLALLAYCDVRRWARQAERQALAEMSLRLVTSCPFADRASFLSQVDRLIAEARLVLDAMDREQPAPQSRSPGPGAFSARP